MGKFINMAVHCTHGGHHYKGVTVHPGVDLSLKDAGCGIPKTQFVFANAQTKPVVFLEGVTGAEYDAERPCPEYLQVVAG